MSLTLDIFGSTDESNKQLPFQLPSEEGYSAIFNETLKGFEITIPNGELFYAEEFFDKKVSDRSIDYFLENKSNDWKSVDWNTLDKEKLNQVEFTNIKWRHDKINMYGKEVYLPRYSAWYGDSDKPYTYSGLRLQPNDWNKGLLHIKDAIKQASGVEFNSVLMNWYRDGSDYISWHTDSEKELGENPVIGSVNFGETRRFIIRRQDDHKVKLEIPLKHGTLLIMRGELQHYWQHQVPKQAKATRARFNLTFRVINH